MFFGKSFANKKGNSVTRSRKLSLENLEERALLAVVAGWEGSAAAFADADVQATAAVPPAGAVEVSDGATFLNLLTGSSDVVISITSDFSVTLSGTSSHSITIYGNNHTITLGDSSANVFAFNFSTGTENLKMYDLTFSGGKGQFGGHFAVCGTNVTSYFENCTFTGGVATATTGGSIYLADGVSHTFKNCTFRNNTVSSTTSNGGGAIYSEKPLFLTDCTFENNTSNFNGGAVYMNNGSCTISGNTVFSGNEAKVSGGAIYSAAAVSITGGQFTGNKAKGPSASGGAIFTLSSLEIDGATFTNNQVLNATGIAYGGAVNGTGAVTTIQNSTFTGNSISTTGIARGGAISSNNTGSTLKVVNCRVTGNVATSTGNYSQGGGIYSNAGYYVLQTLVAENELNAQAGQSMRGAGIYGGGGGSAASGVTGSIYYCTITANKSNNSSTSNTGGLGVYQICGDIDVKGSIIYGNTATGTSHTNTQLAFRVVSPTGSNYTTFRLTDSFIPTYSGATSSKSNVSTGNPGLNADYTISAGSAAKDFTSETGSSVTLNGMTCSADLAGGARKVGASVDAGCYEVQPSAVTLTFSDGSVTYDGQPHMLTVSSTTPAGASVVYSLNQQDWYSASDFLTNANLVDCGTYTIYAKASLSGCLDGTASAVLTINKGTLTPTVTDGEGTASSPASITVTGYPAGAVVRYSTTEGGPYDLTSAPAYNTVGTHTTYVKISGMTNYNDWYGSGEVVITALPMVNWVSVAGWNGMYDGNSHGVTVFGLKSDDTIQYSADGVTYSNNPILYSTGNSTIYVKVAHDGYSDWVGTADINILKAITGVTVTGGEYASGDHSVSVSGASGMTVTYSDSLNGTYSSTNPVCSGGAMTTYVKVSKSGYDDWYGSATVYVGTKITSSSDFNAKLANASAGAAFWFDPAHNWKNDPITLGDTITKAVTIDASMIKDGVLINGNNKTFMNITSGNAVVKNLILTGCDGVFWLSNCSLNVYTCLIADNTRTTAGAHGCAVYSNGATINFYNTTIANNSAAGGYLTGGLFCNGGNTSLYSCIIYGNHGSGYSDYCANGPIRLYNTLYNSTQGYLQNSTSNCYDLGGDGTNLAQIFPNYSTATNIRSKYSLASGSVAIGSEQHAGSNPANLETDLAGNGRTKSITDFGCYEYWKTPTSSTGNIEDATFTYDGTVKSIAVTGAAAGATITYSLDGKNYNYSSVEEMKLVAAGSYTIYAKVKNDSNTYAWRGKATLTIEPRSLTFPVMYDATYTYDGEAHGISNVVKSEDFAEAYPVYTADPQWQNWSTTMPTFTDAGEYTVYAKMTSPNSANTVSGVVHATVTINKAVLNVSGTTVASKAYDGTTDAEVTAFGTLSGAVSGDDVSIGAVTAAFADANAATGKSVSIHYTLAGAQSGNYTLADSAATADINRRTVTVHGPLSQNYVPSSASASFNGVALDNVVDGESLTANITGTYTNTDYAPSKALTVTGGTLVAGAGTNAANYQLSQDDVTVNLTAVVTNLGGSTGAGSLHSVLNAVAQGGGTEVVIDKANISDYDTNAGRIVLNANDGSLNLNGVSLVVADGTNIILDGSALTTASILTISGGTDDAPVTVNNVTFTRKDAGGTVHSSSASAVSVAAGAAAAMTDCSFSYNTSSANGAAVSVAAAGKFTLAKSLSGVAVMESNVTSGHGGAVYSQGTVSLNGISVLNNTATKQGGAIANNSGVLNLVNAIFTGNCAGASYNGGAVMSTGTVTVSGGSFTNNSAGGNGGAVAALGGSVTMTGTSLTGNAVAGYSSLVTPKYGDQDSSANNRSGGAVRVVNNATVTLNDCTISGGYAYNGGAVSVAGGSTLNINGGTFTGNTAVFGGAIANAGTVTIAGYGDTPVYTLFSANKAGGYAAGDGDAYSSGNGGAINNMATGTLTVTGASFESNTTLAAAGDFSKGGNGGAVENWGNASFTGASFTGNTALNGGAVANGKLADSADTAGQLTLTNVTFTSNSAQYGGALLNSAAATLDGVTATLNSAVKNGGAISNTKAGAALTFTGSQSVFGSASSSAEPAANSCSGYGGAILSTAETSVTFNTDVYAYKNSAGEGKGQDFMSTDAVLVGRETYLHVGNAVIEPETAGAALPFVPLPTAGRPALLIESVIRPTAAGLCDIDGDLFVGPGDYSFITAAWLTEEGDENWDPRADLNGDGRITGHDRLVLASLWCENLSPEDLFAEEVVESLIEIPDEIILGEIS